MKKGLKISLYAFASVILLVFLLIMYVFIALPNVSKAEYIDIEITESKVDRGRYLAYHVMMCADCHSERDFSKFSGPPFPGTEFVGGDIFDQSMGFPGKFISSNITPFGIGDWTDGEIFRLITTGVKRDGEPIFPVMPYHNFGQLDREDIEAVIAYLRTLEPVESNHPHSKADFPFNIILRTIPKEAELTTRPEKADRVNYGRYMFTAAACAECHTKFEKGKFVGPIGGGGREFQFPDGSWLRTPNLTPHETGLKNMSREEFIRLFKKYEDSAYVLPDVKPGEFQTMMPWVMYAGMEEDDLSAIYDYLLTLEPYDNVVERFTPAEN
jgi:mono/diheme cytochrome c family protein